VLRRFPGQVIEDAGGRWLVQPLHWRAVQTPPDDLALAIYVVDQTGARVAQLDVPVNGGIAWEPDLVTTLEYRVPLPRELPPGRYRVQAQVYSWADGKVKQLWPATDGAPIVILELPPLEIAPAPVSQAHPSERYPYVPVTAHRALRAICLMLAGAS